MLNRFGFSTKKKPHFLPNGGIVRRLGVINLGSYWV